MNKHDFSGAVCLICRGKKTEVIELECEGCPDPINGSDDICDVCGEEVPVVWVGNNDGNFSMCEACARLALAELRSPILPHGWEWTDRKRPTLRRYDGGGMIDATGSDKCSITGEVPAIVREFFVARYKILHGGNNADHE